MVKRKKKKRNNLAWIFLAVIVTTFFTLYIFESPEPKVTIVPSSYMIDSISIGECLTINYAYKINIEEQLLDWDKMGMEGNYNYRGEKEDRYFIEINGEKVIGTMDIGLVRVSDDYLGYNWYIYTPADRLTEICIKK